MIVNDYEKDRGKTMLTIELKNGRNWEVTHVVEDELEVYQRLTNALIAKKLNQCSYIKSIRRTPLYNGTQKIVILYDNGVRDTYIVKDR